MLAGCAPSPAPEWNSGSARRGGLADVTRFSAVCPAPEWNSGSARSSPPRRAPRTTRFSVFGCVRLGIPSPAEAGSPTQRASACLAVSGWGFHPQPRRAPRRNALQRVWLCQAGDSIPSRKIAFPDAIFQNGHSSMRYGSGASLVLVLLSVLLFAASSSSSGHRSSHTFVEPW